MTNSTKSSSATPKTGPVAGGGLKLAPAGAPLGAADSGDDDAATIMAAPGIPVPGPLDEDDAATVMAAPRQASSGSAGPDDEDQATVMARPAASSSSDDADEATVMARPAAPADDPDEATVMAPIDGGIVPPLARGPGGAVKDATTLRGSGPPIAAPAAAASVPAPQENSDALPVGEMLMWYRIEKVLGQGGFGLTYKAHDTRLDNHVAIKEFLPTQLAIRHRDKTIQPKSEQYRQPFEKGRSRFLDEARTLARFKHSSLVRVATFFEENNTAYMAMEYEEGRPLADLLKEKKTLDEQELMRIVMPLLRGINQLHEANIIHRDIKPDNIFIRHKDGTPVLLDFGSARKTEGGGDGHMTAMLTPNYAPMEQYFEDASRQGPWTDIYAMGAVMYRAISGRKPVGAPQRSSAIMRNQPDPLVPAVEVGQGRYSESLLQAVDMALKVVETDRPKDIREWLKSVHVEQDPETEESVRELLGGGAARSRKLQAILAGAMAAAVLGVGAVFWGLSQDSGPKTLTPEEILANQIAAARSGADQGLPGPMFNLGLFYEEGKGVPINRSAALDWFRKAAEKGWPAAQLKLAKAYDTGLGVPKDAKEATQWYAKAAQAGLPEGAHGYGRALDEGHGIDKNPAEALQWFLKAAEAGEPRSQFQVAKALETGQGLPQDLRKALALHLKAADQNISQANLHAARMFAEGRGVGKDDKKALQYFRQAAHLGIEAAQFELAHRLWDGVGEPANRREAVKWLTESAKQGNLESKVRLARAYADGEGLPPDNSQAQHWFQEAAKGGSAEAQFLLGVRYMKGDGLNPDPLQAAKWFLLAAQQGHVDAQAHLATQLRLGLGVPQDAAEALKWYAKAAGQGHTQAQYQLATLHEKGEGTAVDLKKAAHWYTQAANSGSGPAQNALGWMHEEGRGVPKNLTEAAKWYFKAAKQGELRAQNSLGWMFEEGRGVPKDLVRAHVWYSLAAVHKDKDALRNLQLIEKNMTQEQIRKSNELAKKWLYSRSASSRQEGDGAPAEDGGGGLGE
ncbi:MAG: SEL1-like repeat protein [Magnetococcales bacterium]|nr:SEL1-like repeat protein [Magnetococcales bacterium]